MVVYTSGHNLESTKALLLQTPSSTYLGPGIPEGHAARVTLHRGSFWSSLGKVVQPQTEGYCTLEFGCHTVQGDTHYAGVVPVEEQSLRPQGS